MTVAAVLDPYLTDWLNLLLRWLHVIAAIAWVGASFYFVLLDSALRPPKSREDELRGVAGEAWEVHGGGFYHVQKYRVAPPKLPEHLQWFKWEAYTTWLSGFGLMIVLYYFNASAYLVDPDVLDLDAGWAVAISIGLLAAAWLVYDGLCRLLEGHEAVLATCIVALTAVAAWGCGELFAPRAAFLQVGAMLGTIMSANVFFVIIPAHRELIRAKQAGREPDARPGRIGKQRSVHNNYLTLPVLLTMLLGHFPFVYAARRPWLVVLALMLVGAWIRLFFNRRHAGRNHWSIPITAALVVLVLAWVIRPDDEAASPGQGVVPLSQVQPIVEQRCAPCHSANPTQEGFSSAPAGIVLETAEQIRRQRDAVESVVASGLMPLGNVTRMTDDERNLVVAWASQ
jgi:uncharacterized membrane protein